MFNRVRWDDRRWSEALMRGARGASLALMALLLSVGTAVAKDRLDELDALHRQIDELEESLNAARDQKERALTELEETERRIAQLVRTLRDLERDVVERSAALLQLQQTRTDKEREVRRQSVFLADQLRNMYILGRQERLKLLLSQDRPGVVSRVMAYYEYLSRDRARRIEEMKRRVAELRAVELEVEVERNGLERLLERQREDRRSLELAGVDHRRQVSELDAHLRQTDFALRVAKQNAEALMSLLARLETRALRREEALRKPIEGLKGRLRWPVKGRLASRFGTHRASGGLRWDGVVISASEGREVRAVHHGRVAFADWLRGFGLLLILDHGDGYMSLYGFNQTLLKETGEWVDAEEDIGLVGSSGGRREPGLYFGIRRNGRPENPQLWCKKLAGRRTG